jgi:catechol 2,3-dioxygenase-like lactoylglutathione lyase family enzyme
VTYQPRATPWVTNATEIKPRRGVTYQPRATPWVTNTTEIEPRRGVTYQPRATPWVTNTTEIDPRRGVTKQVRNIMYKSIGALAVYVTDKERAKKFYTDILGFEVAADLGPNLCFLKSPGGEIDIYLEGGMKPSDIDNRTSRLSFFLRAEGSASATFAALREAGVQMLQDEPEAVDDTTACFQFLDPDGNIIEACGTR